MLAGTDYASHIMNKVFQLLNLGLITSWHAMVWASLLSEWWVLSDSSSPCVCRDGVYYQKRCWFQVKVSGSSANTLCDINHSEIVWNNPLFSLCIYCWRIVCTKMCLICRTVIHLSFTGTSFDLFLWNTSWVNNWDPWKGFIDFVFLFKD